MRRRSFGQEKDWRSSEVAIKVMAKESESVTCGVCGGGGVKEGDTINQRRGIRASSGDGTRKRRRRRRCAILRGKRWIKDTKRSKGDALTKEGGV